MLDIKPQLIITLVDLLIIATNHTSNNDLNVMFQKALIFSQI